RDNGSLILRNFLSSVPVPGQAFAVVLASLFATAALAQDDDLYGVPDASPEAADPAEPEESPAPDTSAPPVQVAPGDTAAAPSVAAPDTVPAAPRPRIVRETTVNPLDTRRGNYRNPKK